MDEGEKRGGVNDVARSLTSDADCGLVPGSILQNDPIAVYPIPVWVFERLPWRSQ
jgi:hypothetical protein